ncbi:hypothetical protein [Chryseobacterium sp. SIMBA_029]|uniref:hypothetical protein n=1 Tax=Chryseobacterium sp. SIMBA_029 TaxID=3085772 RepID=UPI00397C2EC6
MKKDHRRRFKKDNFKPRMSKSIYSITHVQKLPFEKSKKILSDAGFSLSDEEIKEISELIHKIAELTIKEFILK